MYGLEEALEDLRWQTPEWGSRHILHSLCTFGFQICPYVSLLSYLVYVCCIGSHLSIILATNKNILLEASTYEMYMFFLYFGNLSSSFMGFHILCLCVLVVCLHLGEMICEILSCPSELEPLRSSSPLSKPVIPRSTAQEAQKSSGSKASHA